MRIGAAFLTLAMAATPLADGFSKDLGADHSAFYVAFLRYFASGVLAVAITRLAGRPALPARWWAGGQVPRTALMALAMTLMIAALARAPLATAVGGFLVAPMVAMLVSVALLGEALTPQRVLGAVISFIGAALIARPQAGLDSGALMALAGGCVMGAYLALARGSMAKGEAFQVLAVQSLLGSALILPVALYSGVEMLTARQLLEVVALGAISAFCHFLVISAYNRADATVLAPFFYMNLIFSIPLGMIWFGEVPGLWSFLGMAAICAGGVIALRGGRALVGMRRKILADPGPRRGTEKMTGW